MNNYGFLELLETDLDVASACDSKAIFKRMFSNLAFKEAESYINEERSALEELIHNIYQANKMDFCIVGGGPFHYLPLATQHFKKYILIEPYLNYLLDARAIKAKKKLNNVECVEKKFEDYCQDFPVSYFTPRTLYVFWFNVVSYIQNPIDCLSKIIKPGDIVFISKWANTEKAQKIWQSYFNYVNLGEKKNSHQALQISQNFLLAQLGCVSSSIQLIKKNITDIVVAYT